MTFQYRLGIDIGGTFTDATLINERTGEIQVGKVSSTPSDPSLGFLEAVHRMLQKSKIDPEQVGYIVHGTTVATNAVLTGNGARARLITTQGFRDILQMRRGWREDFFNNKGSQYFQSRRRSRH